MTMLSRVAALMTGLAMTVVATVGLASSASAAFDPGRVVGPTGWTPDGPVHSVLVSGGRVYIGGTFTGGVAALDATTGALVWQGTANGDVRALAMANGGSHLVIGGAFTAVSSVTHRKLALLSTTDGAAVPGWKAAAGGTVRDIVVSGSTAYFGGGFANHNGIAQANLGAVSTTAGVRATPVTAFNATTNDNVYALAMAGSRLVIGGRFTAVNGAPRSQLASYDVSTRTLDAWAPAPACSNCNLYWDLVINGTTVYTASRNAGAVTAVDLATGQTAAPTTLWRTAANGDAQALTFVDGVLYVGGHFTGIKTVPRTILAALDPANRGAVITTFTPRFVTTYPGIWALASTSSRLYVGGHFTAAGPTPNRYPYFAMFGN